MAAAGDVLVVFDFDESLVEVNAIVDTARVLFPEVQERLEAAWHSGEVTWVGLVNLFHELLAAEKPEATVAQVHEAAAHVPVHPQMLAAVRAAATDHGATVKIVSDASTFYINAVVERHGLSDCISQVVANPMIEHPDVPNRLQMLPFHGPPDPPHECPHCPANMCKGRIVDQLRRERSYARVLYVGDGSGDYCPATRLTANDVVFPRRTKPTGETYELLAAITASPESVRAQVVPWSTGDEIFGHFDRILRVNPSDALPPLAPFDALIKDRVLVVFDYDWSLINENSDTYIFKVLYPELLEEIKARRETQPSWTKLMDDLLQQLALDKPEVKEDTIRQTVARVPILPHMLEAVRLAGTRPNVAIAIVSDANTVYIESMLEHNKLTPLISEVVTNPAAFEQHEGLRSLRVRPYQDPNTPHGCPLCPSNMCKGLILDRLRREQACTRVIYVGDGTGDYCPATRMTSVDTVFARDDDAGGRPFGLLRKVRANSDSVKASVVPWSSGEDIRDGFAAVFARGDSVKPCERPRWELAGKEGHPSGALC